MTRSDLLLCVAVLGLAVRVGLAAVSVGSNDISLWYRYSTAIDANGLAPLYSAEPLFNHPPLAANLGRYSLTAARMLNLPFPYVFKLPAILADVLTGYLLWTLWKRRQDEKRAASVLSLYAFSVCSILISAYHGNTDSLCCALSFLGVFLVNEKRSHFLGGATLAAAINIKLIPLFLVPAIVSGYRSRRDCLLFAAGVSLGILPFAVMMASAGPSFTKNVFHYNSIFELWGVQAFLRGFETLSSIVSAPMAEWFRQASDAYRQMGRYVVAIVIVVLCLYARIRTRSDRYELCALSTALFLVFAPGFGVQYAIYPVAFLFAFSPRWGILYATTAGIFIALVYHHFIISYIPLASWHVLPYPPTYAIPATLTWTILLVFLISRLRVWNATSCEREVDTTLALGVPSPTRPCP